jgi:hypothetical protein
MKYAIALFLTMLALPALAQRGGVSAPDPFIIGEVFPFVGVRDTNCCVARGDTFNSGQKNLALIVAGQSNCGNVNPTLFIPGSTSVIDEKNVYDGGSYNINGMMLGSANGGANPGAGPGNVSARLAQLFITNANFDHIVIGNVCIGSTVAADWATGSTSNRIAVMLKRFASRGITPATTSWTFAITWWQGESDNFNGTTSVSYQASMNTILTNAKNAGFTGRFFINEQTWNAGVTSATIQGAQTGLVDSVNFWLGGNIDTLNATNRNSDNTHLNDTGAAAAALLVYNAMHASGAPF